MPGSGGLGAGGLDGVGGPVVLAGLPDDRIAVVLAAVMDSHPDPQGQGGLAVADRLAAVVAALVGGDAELGVEVVEGLLGVADGVPLGVGVGVDPRSKFALLSTAGLDFIRNWSRGGAKGGVVRRGGQMPDDIELVKWGKKFPAFRSKVWDQRLIFANISADDEELPRREQPQRREEPLTDKQLRDLFPALKTWRR